MASVLDGALAAVLPHRVRSGLERAALAAGALRPGLRRLRVADVAPEASFVAVGDVALTYRAGPPSEAAIAPPTVFQGVAELLRGADLRFANLESVFADAPAERARGIRLRARPEYAAALAAAGFDVVSCANNHMLDFGAPAAHASVAQLHAVGVRGVGFGETAVEARTPVVVEARGLRLGMLAYCEHWRRDLAADGGQPAAAVDAEMVHDVAGLRAAADLVVVQLHWGWEWAMYPPLSYRERARRLVDAGADVVVCHHAHVPMGLEVHGRGLIAHGLGNFLFPYRRPESHPWRNRSFALRVEFGRHGVSAAEIIPTEVGPDHRPAPLRGRARREVLGAHAALRRGLADDAFLARLELDRNAREAASLVRRLAAAADRDDVADVLALGRYLRVPLYRNLVRAVERAGEPGAAIAALLRRAADLELDPALAPHVAREAASAPLHAAVRELERRCLAGRVPLGRVP